MKTKSILNNGLIIAFLATGLGGQVNSDAGLPGGAIAAGWRHSVYLKTDGTVWAVGSNGFGELGDNSTTDRSTPVQVMKNGVEAMDGVEAIVAGSSRSFFLTTDGTVWAIGANTHGQLGDNSKTNRYTPVQVMKNGLEVMSEVEAISVGGLHSLFLTTNHTAWATGTVPWWYNDFRQPPSEGHTHYTPQYQIGEVRGIAAGNSHSLFLKNDGTVRAIGFNLSGELGDGSTTNRSKLVQVMIAGVQAIAAGGGYSLYLKTDGTAWATGGNTVGQLGDGSTTNRSTPVQVMNEVAAIAAGSHHNLFLKTDGTVWATGENRSGELGDGSTTNRSTPVQVMNEVAAIAAGGNHSLFLKTDGTVWATGDNRYGQLGDGSATNRYTPVQTLFGAELGVDPLIGGTSLPGFEDWFLADWFGIYYTAYAPWIFHQGHGFVYRHPESSDASLYLYDEAMGAWWWTNQTIYPFIFAFSPPTDNAGTDIESAWLWCFEGETEPRVFGVVTGPKVGEFLFFGP